LKKHILVCGGRDYNDHSVVDKVLKHVKNICGDDFIVVCGLAKGADSIAAYWARENDIAIHGYAADWSTHGKSAGPKRNQQMLDSEPIDLVIAFPGNRGTLDAITRSRKKSIPVVKVKSNLQFVLDELSSLLVNSG